MAVSDPSSGLPTFQAHFDSLEFNSLTASHFHCFGPPFASFLLFSVPAEGLPLLEGLFTAHGDFTSEFRGGVFLGNISMELLCAVLISLRDSSLDSLYEERLLEWRRVVQDLIKARSNLSSFLEYLRSLAQTLFQRKASKDLDAEIIATEKVLAHAHKALQDLKVKKQLILSSSTVPTVPLESSLLASRCISFFLFSLFFFFFFFFFFLLDNLRCISFYFSLFLELLLTTFFMIYGSVPYVFFWHLFLLFFFFHFSLSFF